LIYYFLVFVTLDVADVDAIDTSGPRDGDNSNQGAIIGGVIGAILGLLLLIVIIIVIIVLCRRRRRKYNTTETWFNKERKLC